MDVSHITNLLSSLGKNQVTLPIFENDFQETKVESYYMKNVSKDIFADLDDIVLMSQRYHKNLPLKTSKKVRVFGVSETSASASVTPSTQSNASVPPSCKPSIKAPTYNVVYALACIRDNMLTLENKQDKIRDHTNQFSTTLREYVAQCTVRKLNIEINDEKVSKDILKEYLDMALESNINGMPMHHNQYDIIVRVASRYLQKNIAIIMQKNDVLVKEYLESNDNIAEYITIQMTSTDNQVSFTLGDNVSASTINNAYHQAAMRKLKLKDDFQENLKHQSVKDLRCIAKDIGIDTVDANTGKLYSKADLKHLIEAQLKTVS